MDMLQELVFHHIEKKVSRYLFLNQDFYHVGKSLDNDIVLLEGDIPSCVAVIEKRDADFVWKEQDREIILGKNKYKTNGYSIHIANHQKSILFLIIGVLICSAFLFFQLILEKKEFSYVATIDLPARGVYGSMDLKTPVDSVKFEFQPNTDRYSVLHYTPGNLKELGDLKIIVNGHSLGSSPVSLGKWNVEQTQYIPKAWLTSPKSKLEFLFCGQEKYPWGVKDIYIEESDEAPSEKNGADFLKNARKLFRERNIKKGNLVRAEQVVQQAEIFYRFNHIEPPEGLEKLSLKIRNEKHQMIQDHQMLARKYRQQGETVIADNISEKLLDELIDPMDPDRTQIEKEQAGAQ